jgi:TolB-like protein
VSGALPPDASSGRRWWLLVAIVAVTAGGIVFAMMEGRRESKVTPAAARLAVLPLRADGDTALARLGRALAAAIATALNDVKDVHAVDTGVVLALAGARPVTAERADSIGRALGASAYVFGEIDEVNGRVRAEIRLRSTERGGPAAEIVAGGPANDVGLLADSLTWAVLRRLYRGHNMPQPLTPRLQLR